jgi:cytochrome P450
MSQHPANHSKRNWTDPEAFVPERWLGDAKYKDDNRAVMNPFSFGPRNCLGKRYVSDPQLNGVRYANRFDSLAHAEMRLIAAKVLFNFDLELKEESGNWLQDQKVFGLWEKPELKVKLVPVKR